MYFSSKSENVNYESAEETEVKTDIVVGIKSALKETQKVKRKSPTNDIKNNVTKPGIKKKKSILQNWDVSDDV